MIIQTFDITRYDWHVVVYYNASHNDVVLLIQLLRKLDCPREQAVIAAKTIVNKNTGFIYTNTKLKMSMLCISKTTTEGQFMNTVVHEAMHLLQHISSYYKLDEKGEEVAYMLGDTVMMMYNYFKRFINYD